jgi:hypothetical protein
LHTDISSEAIQYHHTFLPVYANLITLDKFHTNDPWQHMQTSTFHKQYHLECFILLSRAKINPVVWVFHLRVLLQNCGVSIGTLQQMYNKHALM